jgi:hypothetical protein
MHRNPPACWLLTFLSDLQLVVQPHNRVLCLVFNLLEVLVDVRPKILAKNLFIVERVADQPFDLFFNRSVKVFQWVWNNFLLLMFKWVLNWLCKFRHFCLSPFRLVAYLCYDLFELLNCLWLNVLDCFNAFFFHEMLIHVFDKLLEAFFWNHSDLERKAELNFPFQKFEKIGFDLFSFLLNVTCSFLIVGIDHFLNNCLDIFAKVFVHFSFWP